MTVSPDSNKPLYMSDFKGSGFDPEQMKKQFSDFWKQTVEQMEDIREVVVGASQTLKDRVEATFLRRERDRLFQQLGEDAFLLVETGKMKAPLALKDTIERIRTIGEEIDEEAKRQAAEEAKAESEPVKPEPSGAEEKGAKKSDDPRSDLGDSDVSQEKKSATEKKDSAKKPASKKKSAAKTTTKTDGAKSKTAPAKKKATPAKKPASSEKKTASSGKKEVSSAKKKTVFKSEADK